jgi:transcription elongation GreA/GreB family factor
MLPRMLALVFLNLPESFLPFILMKSELLEIIRAELRTRLERLARAAMDAHAAATDPGSKAESKYDTRSLEESYLATGQARQVQELAETFQVFESLRPVDFSKADEIASGALVELKRGNEKLFFLLVPAAGGLEITHKKREITLLSPDSPLYRALIGKKIGDSLEALPFQVQRIS